MKNTLTIYLFLMFTFFSSAPYAATFKGKVIDADSKEPIEGAVVVASWLEETTTVGATHTEVKDGKETLTNKNGEWVIKGSQGRKIGNITAIFTLITGTYITTPPEFIVFKPGYCSYPAGFGIESCKMKIKTYNATNSKTIGEVVELPKLKERDQETLLRNRPFIPFEDDKKIPIYKQLIEQDRGYDRR